MDDAFYARIAVEAERSGRFFTMTWNGHPNFQKPPLQFWLVGRFFAAFGEHDLVARLPSIVMALGLARGDVPDRRADRWAGGRSHRCRRPRALALFHRSRPPRHAGDPVRSLDSARDADRAREPAAAPPDGALRAAARGRDLDQERAGLAAAPGSRDERGGDSGAAGIHQEALDLDRSPRRSRACRDVDHPSGRDLRRGSAQRALPRRGEAAQRDERRPRAIPPRVSMAAPGFLPACDHPGRARRVRALAKPRRARRDRPPPCVSGRSYRFSR